MTEVLEEKAQILIVDDDAGMRETLRDILEDKGYAVYLASDGRQAIQTVSSNGSRFDLIMIDVMMPELGGVETLREIRKLAPEATTMIMTGYDSQEQAIAEALDAGVDGVLYKPFDISVIDEAMETRSREEVGPRRREAPTVDLKKYSVDVMALAMVPEDLARRYSVIALKVEDGLLRVAMEDPNNVDAIDALQTRTRLRVRPVRATPEDIHHALDQYYKAEGEIQFEVEQVEGIEEEEAVPEEVIAEAPVVRALDLIITQAIKDRASDVHIEPEENRLRVRYRIDGVLHESASLPLGIHQPLLSRIKVRSNLNIAEKRRPQDGQFSHRFQGKPVDIRVATSPTTWGEMAVLRVLDKALSFVPLDQLGMLPEVLETYRRLIHSPFGMLLVCGPTGSGKTTTLYASINQLDRVQRNIITIEDPVEFNFQGINQIKVNKQAGVDFATGLRAILRLDPDVILVGEIRDTDTAEVAVQSALTGHLVMSSIHANDAVGALTRLRDLGVEPFLITSAVVGVMSQRLVRKICNGCKTSKPAGAEETQAYQIEMSEERQEFVVGAGCNLCGHTGYTGRIGVFEVLMVNDEIRALVLEGAGQDRIRRVAIKDGMLTMRKDGMTKVKAGLTTPHEVMRNVFLLG